MSNIEINVDDLDISLRIYEDESTAVINHLYIAEEYRNQGHGTFVLETVKRIAFENHNVDCLEVSIGGGKKTEQFLKKNGFRIIDRRHYQENSKEHLEGEYGVDAVYLRKWISEDYGIR